MSKKSEHRMIKHTQQAELGQHLVTTAEALKKKTEQEEIVKLVADILRKITESEKTITIGQCALAHFKAQKEAMEKGLFTFHPWRKQIIFNDPLLNQNYQDLAYYAGGGQG